MNRIGMVFGNKVDEVGIITDRRLGPIYTRAQYEIHWIKGYRSGCSGWYDIKDDVEAGFKVGDLYEIKDPQLRKLAKLKMLK